MKSISGVSGEVLLDEDRLDENNAVDVDRFDFLKLPGDRPNVEDEIKLSGKRKRSHMLDSIRLSHEVHGIKIKRLYSAGCCTVLVC